MPQDPNAGAESAAGTEAPEEKMKKMTEEMAKLSEAMKTRDAEYQTLKETYERTNALLQATLDNPDRGSSRDSSGGGSGRGSEIDLGADFQEKWGVPNEAVQQIIAQTLKVAEQRLDKRVVGLTQMAQLREKFYKDNPDLVGHELLVGTISQQVGSENPTLSLDKQFVMAADKTRAYIKRLQDGRSGGDNPDVPLSTPGGGNRDGMDISGGGGGEPEEVDPDRELQAEIASRNKMRTRGMNRARSV